MNSIPGFRALIFHLSLKGKHGKKYATAEDIGRQKQWQAACSKIAAHNALHAKGQASYQLEDNFMADLVRES